MPFATYWCAWWRMYILYNFAFTVGYVCLCGVCRHVVVLGLSVRLSWYPMWMRVFEVTVMHALLFVLDVSMFRVSG